MSSPKKEIQCLIITWCCNSGFSSPGNCPSYLTSARLRDNDWPNKLLALYLWKFWPSPIPTYYLIFALFSIQTKVYWSIIRMCKSIQDLKTLLGSGNSHLKWAIEIFHVQCIWWLYKNLFLDKFPKSRLYNVQVNQNVAFDEQYYRVY